MSGSAPAAPRHWNGSVPESEAMGRPFWYAARSVMASTCAPPGVGVVSVIAPLRTRSRA